MRSRISPTQSGEELESLLTEDYACRCVGGDYEYVANSRQEFLGMIENSFHSEIVTQHNGHGPEIERLSEDEATGIVYFHDQVYHFRTQEFLMGTGIYRDHYRKEDGRWRISHGVYERVYELTETLPRKPHFSAHYLGEHGKKLPADAAYDPTTGKYS